MNRGMLDYYRLWRSWWTLETENIVGFQLEGMAADDFLIQDNSHSEPSSNAVVNDIESSADGLSKRRDIFICLEKTILFS